ncbi:MAG: RNA pyrophosphohydrolase [Rhodospirillales bacterium]|nr:RNA pyrophosphohydrolase [Rhodospirillales bacterium]
MIDSKHNSVLPYRPCVGLVLFNKDGKVFVGERLDSPGGWQLPQGGIELGENIEHAALRELSEEVGTTSATILEIMDHTIRYDLPEGLRSTLWGGQYRGQEQYWIALQFTGKDSEIDLETHEHPEFSRWKWVALEEIIDLIVPFKREVYKQVACTFRPLAAEISSRSKDSRPDRMHLAEFATDAR